MSDNLPEGWVRVPLNRLLEPGGIFDGPFGSHLKTSDYTERGVRVVRLENLANLRFVEEKRSYISRTKYETLRRHTVVPGDILFGSFVDSDVRVCLLPPLQTPAVAKADCFCIRTMKESVDRQFLVYQLGTSATRHSFLEEIHGVTRPRITTKQLRAFNVAVAPIVEQRRITEAIEALLTEVRAARRRLAIIPPVLKRFRQSVLAAACEGRLTHEWRTEHPELTSCDFGHAAGNEWLEPLFEHREEQELPAGWRYVALGNLGAWGSGGTPSKAREDFWKAGTVPWISPKDMKVSLIGDSQDHITELAVRSGATMVPPGTILFVVRGMILAHTFPVGLTTRLVTFNQDIRSIVPRREVHSKYLLHALQREGSNVLFAVKEATHGTLRLESSTLRRWPIAVPPREEQAEIVRRIDLFMVLADTIERSVAAASTRAEALTQSILAKAFRGELVPTEAELARADGRDYESGEALLARIRGERAPIVPPSKGHRGRSLRAGARS